MNIRTLSVLLIIAFLQNEECYSQDWLRSAIDSLIEKQFKPDGPGGEVMVARKGAIIYERAFGTANKDHHTPMKEDTPFFIGSNTKQFTAVCILQLFEQGRLQLHDTLGKFLSCPVPVSHISLQQLLAQTSGLGKQLDSPMRFSPGTRWEYNNENYQALGKVIEKVTGISYPDYLQKYIFTPAGMTRSYLARDNDAFAAGGIRCPATDLLKWNQALQSGELLKPETLRLAFTSQLLTDGNPTTYGFGWRLGELHGSTLIWHGGLMPGCASETLYFPTEDVYAVLYVNSDSDTIPLLPLSRIVGGEAIGKPYHFTELHDIPDSLQRYVGLYDDDLSQPVNISLEGGNLFFQRPYGEKYPLVFAGEDHFFIKRNYYSLQFYRDSLQRTNSFLFSPMDYPSHTWVKTHKPLLPLAAGRIPENRLKQYEGKYLLGAGDTITITRSGPPLVIRKSGMGKALLLPESDQLFFTYKEGIKIDFFSNGDSLIFYKGTDRKIARKM